MKFKKAFAVILAVAMVITLMPTMAFATTSNNISGVKTVAKNTVFASTLELEVKGNPQNWNVDSNGDIIEEVTLDIDNAKWYYGDSGSEETSSKLSADAFGVDTEAVKAKIVGNANITTAEVEYCSPTSVILTIDQDSGSSKVLETGDVIELTLNLKSTTSTGDVTVDLASTSGNITGGSYTIATVVSAATAATVPDAGTDDLELITIRNSDQTASDIVIRETSAGVVTGAGTHSFTLTLPKEVSWNGVMEKKNDAECNTYAYVSGSLLDDSDPANLVVTIDPNNSRKLTITFKASTDNGLRRTLTITPVVDTTKNAKEGDLTVTLRGTQGDISDASNLVIGQIGQADVSVYVDEEDYSEGEIPALYSGLDVATADQDASDYDQDDIAIITIKENKAGNLTAGKYIDFTFDPQVQLLGDVMVSANGAAATKAAGLDSKATYNKDKDRSTFGYKIAPNDVIEEENELKFYIPITVEAGFEGDVECVVSGAAAGIAEDVTVVVATAKPVLTVETEVSEVRTGIQNQKINDIILTETEAGALKDVDNTKAAEDVVATHDVTVELPFELAKDATVEVTDGDLEIDSVNAKKGSSSISFEIDAESVDKASTITISDLEITLSRNPAEGGYDIKTLGDAVVNNGAYNDDAFADAYVSEGAIEIITPADPSIIDNKINATFVVGESQYSNNGVTVAMDVASFIQNNRTYVPVRYLANALGVTDENIAWNEGARTVTLTGANTVVKLTVGSNIITTSTGTITADVPVIIQNNRTYLPARFVANAFGADVAWDAATRTVTITK